MPHPTVADTPALLAALYRAGIEFVVVGGTAAQLHGSTLGTIDLDIVHRRSHENVARLLAMLHDLDAFHRYDLAARQLRPTSEQLLGSGQLNRPRRSDHSIRYASSILGRATKSSSPIPRS